MPPIAFLAALPFVIFAFPTALRSEQTGFHQVNFNGHTFTLPIGFEIELAAGPALVERPIHADFDERGFLYVADSSGSNEPVAKQLEKKTHRIVRLQDCTGSGRFDKRTVFADKMMFPEGAMWRGGSLYVAAAAEHLEADRHQGQRHCRPARGMVPGQDADWLCERLTRPVRGAGRVDLLGAKARSPSRSTTRPASCPSSHVQPMFSVAGLTEPASKR